MSGNMDSTGFGWNPQGGLHMSRRTTVAVVIAVLTVIIGGGTGVNALLVGSPKNDAKVQKIEDRVEQLKSWSVQTDREQTRLHTSLDGKIEVIETNQKEMKQDLGTIKESSFRQEAIMNYLVEKLDGG